MISAVLSFLGGTTFRMLWGEVAAWLSKRQDHKHELERMRLSAELEGARFARQQEAVKLHADLGIKVIEAKSEAAVSEVEAEAWLAAVKATGRKVGVAWVDAWNAAIRPGVATWAVLMLTLEGFAVIALSEGSASVCFAALGLYLADRTLAKRGK